MDTVKGSSVQESAIRMALAGVASMISGFVTHPIDTVKIRLQKEGEVVAGVPKQKKYFNIVTGMKVIVQEEGFFSLYKGLQASLLREATYSTLRLGLYEPFKEMLGATDPKNTPVWKKFMAGLLSGSAGALVSNPLDLIKVRLQNVEGRAKKGFIQEISKIIEAQGVQGLWRGLMPNLTRGAILTGTKMTTYDHTKHMIQKYLHIKEGFSVYLICSFVTGFVLSVTTSPMDVIKTRIMSQKMGAKTYNGLIDCAVKTYQFEGIKGFYKGFIPQWCRFGPMNVIQLISWEYLRKLFGIKTL
ncbi:hypothetical protein ABPG74_016457 [Tetrahymena malaccensis]